jgi:hypothetical protein
MSISYATLAQIQSQEETPSTAAADITRLLEFGQRATAKIDDEKKFEFAPRIETHKLDIANTRIDLGLAQITLDSPLLSLTSVTLANETALVVDTDVEAATSYPRNGTPYDTLQMLNSSNSWIDRTDRFNRNVLVTGIWGYRSRYATDGFRDSGDSVQDGSGINATDTTITVTDANGAGNDGLTPRFSAGNLILIESEFIEIVATDTDLNTLTVVRGVRGSTAATHANATQIDVFFPETAIVRAAMLIADFNYANRGNHKRVSFDGVRVTATIDIPPEAVEILDSFSFYPLSASV